MVVSAKNRNMRVFAILIALGISIPLGIWTSTEFEYLSGEKYRILGFPLPTAVFAWEGDQWIDYVFKPATVYGLICLNILIFAFPIYFVFCGMRMICIKWGGYK